MTKDIKTLRTVGDRVRWLRKTKGVTQVQLAKLAEVDQSTISKLERSETKKSFGATLLGVAAALSANIDWLQTGKGEPFGTIRYDQDDLAEIVNRMPEHKRAVLLAIAKTLDAAEDQ